MGFVYFPKLIYQVYISYILIIIVDKTRNPKFLNWIRFKNLLYNTFIYWSLYKTLSLPLYPILHFIHSMDIT